MDANSRERSADSRLLFLGSLLLVSGSAIFYVMPAYLEWLGSRLRLDSEQLGVLAAVESLGIGITSLLGPLWVTRIGLRFAILFGILVCVLGNVWTAFSDSNLVVLTSRFAIGLLGEGTFYTVSYAILGRVHNVDRAFAIAVTSVVTFGAAAIRSAAVLERGLPDFGLLAPLIGIALAIVPFIGWVSLASHAPRSVASAPAGPRTTNGVALLALFAQAIWLAAPGAFWTFAEKIATDKGIPSAAVELALSLAVVASLSGCVLAVWLGDRWGRLPPIVGATTGMIVSAFAYQMGHGIGTLGFLLSLFYTCWNYGTVYQLSFVSWLDRDGRIAVMMPAAQVFGLSVGPLCAGRLMVMSGDWAVAITTTVFAVSGVVLYLTCGILQKASGAPTSLTTKHSVSS